MIHTCINLPVQNRKTDKQTEYRTRLTDGHTMENGALMTMKVYKREVDVFGKIKIYTQHKNMVEHVRHLQ